MIKTLEVPRKLSDVPEYMAATEKLREVEDRRQRNVDQQRQLERQLDELMYEGPAIVHTRAVALLEGNEEAAKTDEVVVLEGKIKEVAEMQPVLDEAVQIQRAEFNRVKDEFSNELCAGLKPEHDELVRGGRDAMEKFRLAVAAEETFRASLSKSGVNVRQHFPSLFGLMADYPDPSAETVEIWRQRATQRYEVFAAD